jgi:hypothetical protein
MMKKLIILVLGIASTFYACKKDKKGTLNPNISYRTVNQTVKASDLDPLTLDLNQDGTVDYTFFAVYSVSANAVHLNVGTNPIGNNLAKMAQPDDDKFQNMGNLISQAKGTSINQDLKANQLWSNDFAYLTIRTESQQGNKTYIGAWSDGTPQLMALQLNINGTNYFGWARLTFNRTTEVLTLVDCAWNKNANESIKAGN